MFATLCDRCKRRSPEWEQWPTCRGCMEHLCIDCEVPDQQQGGDGDPLTTLCPECQEAGEE